MERARAHELSKVTRYAFGDLNGIERESLEGHLQSCRSCREFLAFVRHFTVRLWETKPQGPLPGEPCPDPVLLLALQEDELDNETAQHVRVHMLYCKHCREDFQALEKLQPRIMEAVLRLAGSLIEVLRPPETGTWESHLSTATVRGEPAPSALFRMTQSLMDEGRNEARVTVQIDAGIESDQVRVLTESEDVASEWEWSASLIDGKEGECVGAPFHSGQILLTSGIPLGLYKVEIRKGDHDLGAFMFTVEKMRLAEGLEMAREYVQNEDYLRALTLVKDALRGDPDNRSLLEELHRVEDLLEKQEKTQEDNGGDVAKRE